MSELMHYGVKGQKKGVRYHQSYETAPTRSGMVGEERGDAAKRRVSRKEMSAYNYRNSTKYKNGSTADRRAMSNVYRTRSAMVGKKAANRIAYKEHELGKNGNRELAKTAIKRAGVGIGALAALSYLAGGGLNKHKAYYRRAKVSIKASNDMVNQIAYAKGLKTYHKPGLAGIHITERAIKAGDAIFSELVKHYHF